MAKLYVELDRLKEKNAYSSTDHVIGNNNMMSRGHQKSILNLPVLQALLRI